MSAKARGIDWASALQYLFVLLCTQSSALRQPFFPLLLQRNK